MYHDERKLILVVPFLPPLIRHLGWNLFMGHFLGRSTSGIPMSCAIINIVPKPMKSYEKYHGGKNGPEQGVLAPLAYVVGMMMVCAVYGSEKLDAWRDQLVLLSQ